jgi:hypothetical protein
MAYNGGLAQYRLQNGSFASRSRTLRPDRQNPAASHLGSSLGLNVIGITRGRISTLAPRSPTTIRPGDELIVEGRLDRIQEMNNWGQLLSEPPIPAQIQPAGVWPAGGGNPYSARS